MKFLTALFAGILFGAGLVISGTSPDERLVEIIELRDHPYFVASQFHPEFKSRPQRPAPLFRDFVRAAFDYRNAREHAPDHAQPLELRGAQTEQAGRFSRE